MRTFILILTFLFVSENYSQTEVEAEKNFKRIKNVLSTENDLEKLRQKLDSLRSTFKDKKNNFVDNFLNRSIDFEYNHNRIRIQFDLWFYQIDLITKNDTIFLKSIKTEYFNKLTYQSYEQNLLKDYLEKRNSFYNSNKALKDLLKEISIDETFAMYCGDGLPYTEEGKKIKKLVKRKNIKNLKKMLTSFNCEKQSFGVLGFKLLAEEGIIIPKEYEKLIEHIKTRNSELQICSGCITGLIEKVY
jgi:hypothetical protein